MNVQIFLTEHLVNFGIGAVSFVAILIVGWIVKNWIVRIIDAGVVRSGIDETIGRFIGSTANIVLTILILITAVSSTGVEIIGFGALLAGVGLALGGLFSGALSDAAAAVIILSFKPYEVDHIIETNGVTGKVNKITLFHTILHTPDDKDIIVPNSKITADKIVNWTISGAKRVDVVIGVNYGEEKQAEKIFKAVVAELQDEGVLLSSREPVIESLELTAHGDNWLVAPYATTDNYWAALFALNRRIWEEFEKAGIGISKDMLEIYPQS